MKILVCVKSVPDPESSFAINPAGNGYDESGLAFKANEYDVYAMEEAVRIKERFPDVEITAVTVGPVRAKEQLKKTMGIGADRGVLIEDNDAASKDALSIASYIAAFAKDENFDLILCGVMSEDMQRSQTGPMLAALLQLPWATTVIAEEIGEDRGKIMCERELEGGLREKVELYLPALITVQSGINVPRYPSLTNVLRFRKYEPALMAASTLGSVRQSERILAAGLSKPSIDCEFLQGDLGEVAEKMIEIIRKRVQVL